MAEKQVSSEKDIISTKFAKNSQKSKVFLKTGLLINEWENLAALSNRRLSAQNLVHSFRLSWSIDRITVVGKVKKYFWIRDDFQVIELDFEQIWQVFESQGIAEKRGQGWVLFDKYGENIAYAEKVKYDKEKGRIDFNPAKIGQYLSEDLKHFIHRIFDNPHFSRADVACDILDLPDDFVRQYRIVDPVSFKPIYGASGELETAYWGSRSSERQIRMYNKKLEQTKKRKIVPKEINTWWRLEVQLRRGKASNWFNVMNESLSSFCSPNYMSDKFSGIEKAVVVGLMTEQNLWSELARNTKYKYRNLIKEIVIDDELTQHLKSSFSESAKDLKDELDSWLIGLDVTVENDDFES